MIATARKHRLKTFHAELHVTRVEHWSVDARSEEEARELLISGLGARCGVGERVHAEVDAIEEG